MSEDELLDLLRGEFWRDGFDVGDVADICLRAAQRIEQLEKQINKKTSECENQNYLPDDWMEQVVKAIRASK